MPPAKMTEVTSFCQVVRLARGAGNGVAYHRQTGLSECIEDRLDEAGFQIGTCILKVTSSDFGSEVDIPNEALNLLTISYRTRCNNTALPSHCFQCWR